MVSGEEITSNRHLAFSLIAMMPKERRRTPRHPFGRVAAIMFGQGEERPCLVKDYSDGGVRLQLNGFEVPDNFALLFAPNEPARSGRYKVVWRLGKDVGAKFIGPASFPTEHKAPQRSPPVCFWGSPLPS
jgi:PilZ domain